MPFFGFNGLIFFSSCRTHAPFVMKPRKYSSLINTGALVCLCFQFILQEVNITLPENSAWYERYKFDIPAFHLNGQFLMMHRVNTSKLEKQLLKLEQQSARG
ncbi:protein C5orf63-like protein [Plecturocebus cupreus]